VICRQPIAAGGPIGGEHDRHQPGHFIVAVQHATAAYQGRHLDITGCQLMRVEEGRIIEVRGHYSDQHALDGFWKTE
jgi:hypothetical protein